MIPSGRRVPLPVTSPTSSAFPKSSLWVGVPRIAPQRDFMRWVFRDRRYSLRSGLLVCSPPRSPLPLRIKGRRAAGWVASGDCSPEAPADPDVRNYRIRLFGARIRYVTAVERMRGSGRG